MKHSNFRQRGFLAMETAIVLLLFSVMIVLVNNGIVNVVIQEWSNAAKAAAMAGAVKLQEEGNNPNAIELAKNEALQFALLHTWLGRPIQAGQVTVHVGDWSNCVFIDEEDAAQFTTVQVNVYPPVDEQGNFTDITAFFGRLQALMIQTLPTKISASATNISTVGESLLVEDEGDACQG